MTEKTVRLSEKTLKKAFQDTTGHYSGVGTMKRCKL